MSIAIYSRKSKFTGKGESIENQIIKCKKFIYFKFSDIPDKEIEIYIDEGFSGKNEDRPEYKKMISKVKDKKINKIIIYQLNRLGRNARDIHNTMEMCTNLNCIIYSATEGFDSSTSFGRAVIGILASLAQLERDQLVERIKDNMYTLARMGRWLGGQSPLGFDCIRKTYRDENMKERYMTILTKNPKELKLVKKIYSKYLELQSLSQVYKWILAENIKGKNGGIIDKNSINVILQNPVYVQSSPEVLEYLSTLNYEVCGEANGNGILRYGKTEGKIAAVSNHKGIITPKSWLKVQSIIKNNTNKAPRLGRTNTALLTPLLKCSCGSSMRVIYGKPYPDGTKRFYYTCTLKNNSGKIKCNSKNLNGLEIENLIIENIQIKSSEYIFSTLENLIQSTDKNEKVNKLNTLLKEKTSLNSKISNLINKLSLTNNEEISKLLLDQIEMLKNKVKNLDLKIENFNKMEYETIDAYTKTSTEIEKFDNFKNNFDNLDFERKKKCLKEIVDQIIWDSDSKEITITYK